MYTMILDTEFIQRKQGKICYNIGYAIIKNKSQIIKARSIVINENFNKLCIEYMENIDHDGGLFLKNKTKILIDYRLHSNNFQFMDKKDFINLFKKDITENNITLIWGYNVAVDKSALQSIKEDITDNLIFCDIMVNCKNIFYHTKKYQNFCIKNNYITDKGNIRYNAEIMYRFLIDNEFTEDHTALNDVFCEYELLKLCYKKHRKMYIKSKIGLKETLKENRIYK